ncbi:hypothetical protein AAW51_4119 [Caldimonas brevitalea]|uniref:Uncharacterized protein n=1 Tax=Caldimonas brevitalea TaxID=413882 RepID=A0A0G3BWC9_9BURK|nr:hypothetical protein AAW51_4119 [Caldimonas brevitalea]
MGDDDIEVGMRFLKLFDVEGCMLREDVAKIIGGPPSFVDQKIPGFHSVVQQVCKNSGDAVHQAII